MEDKGPMILFKEIGKICQKQLFEEIDLKNIVPALFWRANVMTTVRKLISEKSLRRDSLERKCKKMITLGATSSPKKRKKMEFQVFSRALILVTLLRALISTGLRIRGLEFYINAFLAWVLPGISPRKIVDKGDDKLL